MQLVIETLLLPNNHLLDFVPRLHLTRRQNAPGLEWGKTSVKQTEESNCFSHYLAAAFWFVYYG